MSTTMRRNIGTPVFRVQSLRASQESEQFFDHADFAKEIEKEKRDYESQRCDDDRIDHEFENRMLIGMTVWDFLDGSYSSPHSSLPPKIDIENSKEVLGTTMVNVVNSESAESNTLSPLDLTTELISSDTGQTKPVEQFLGIPRIWKQGQLDTTDANVVQSGLMPFEALNLGGGILAYKIRGFLGMRATLVAKLQVNSGPFNQGRYKLAFVHNGGIANTTLQTQWFNMHTFTKCQVSQLPGVELDISCQSEVTLKIPFVSAEPHYPLGNFFNAGSGPGNIGHLLLYAYQPLSVPTGAIKPKYTIWTYFEDVHMLGPTVAQMNKLELGEMNGPISGPASKIATIAGTLSAFPHLSAYAKPVQWASNIVAGVAKTLGYSRPTSEGPVNRVKRQITSSLANTDVIDTGEKLAFSNEYAIESVPGFAGTDIDEMSFKYLFSIWSWLNTVTWTPTDIAGTALIQLTVSPFNYLTSSDSGNTVRNYAPYTTVCSLFNYWRGSIEYKFKIVKTNFHSGRLLVVYQPFDARFASYSLPAMATSLDGQSMIIDIKEGMEFTVTCPFISSTPWRDQWTNDMASRLIVYVLDPLQSPDNVSANVSIIYEHRPGPDFAVGGDSPYTGLFRPYVPSAPQSAWRPDCDIADETLGGKINMSNKYSRAIIGNQIVSLRSLIKKPCRVEAEVVTFTVSTKLGFCPVKCEVPSYGGIAPGTFSNRYDYVTLCTTMFALSRGSVNLKLIPSFMGSKFTNDTNTNTIDVAGLWTAEYVHVSGAGWYQTTDISAAARNPIAMGNLSIGEVPEVTVPGYNKFLSRANPELMTVTSVHDHYYEGVCTFNIKGNATNATDTCYLFRSGADDFEVGAFVSVPPLLFD